MSGTNLIDRERCLQEIRKLTRFYRINLGDACVNPAGEDREQVILDALSFVDLRDKSMLEMGCSYGHFHYPLSKAGVKRACCIDYFAQEVQVARLVDQYLGIDDRFQVHRLDVERGNLRRDLRGLFDRCEFDVVFCLGVIYHLLGPLRVFLQFPLLVPVGGHLVIETAVDPRVESDFGNELVYLREDSLPLQLTWICNTAHILRVVESLGFKIIAAKGYIYPHYNAVPLAKADRLLIAAKRITAEVKGFTICEEGDWIRPFFPTRDAAG